MPSELDGKHTRLREKIAKWHGNEFERAYMDAMVDEHEDVLDALEPRVDEKTLAEYKAEMDDRLSGKKQIELSQVVAINPEKSDNPVTTSLNEWAAATYPIVPCASGCRQGAENRRRQPSADHELKDQ